MIQSFSLSPAQCDENPAGAGSGSHAPAGRIAFIGGGNMATAIIGGLLGKGMSADAIEVVEPMPTARAELARKLGVVAIAEASSRLADCDLVVWAVKPQHFHAAAVAVAPCIATPLHLSIAAGVSIDSIGAWTGSARVVRAMPNTPALIGQGVTGLFAGSAVTDADRQLIEQVLAATGGLTWLTRESLLDAVTAISGSGPAYVFYFLEVMVDTGIAMGLSAEQARDLAIGTFTGASALAAASDDPMQVLRARVTSTGGTTHAAIASMEAHELRRHFSRAMVAAQQRAEALGREFDVA